MLDNFEKAETLSFLWEGTGRTIGQAAVAGILGAPANSRACSRPSCRSTTSASTPPRRSCRSRADEQAQVEALWSRNFDHVDRYVMPLKSSV